MFGLKVHCVLHPTLLTALVGMAALPIAAQAYVAPLDLNPGDPFRLIFETSSIRNATSADISVYDEFVTLAAGNNPLLPTTSWRAIGSTPTVNAVDHVACLGVCASAPIYNVNGYRVSDSGATLFGGGVQNAIPYESGASANYYLIFSGSTNNGIGIPGSELGAAAIDENTAPASRWGWGGTYGAGYWLDGGGATDQTGSLSFLALSGTNWAAETTNTPEPLSAALLVSGLAVLAAARKRRAARTV
jgi:hypothetical protein